MDLAIRPPILILYTLACLLLGCTALVTPGATSEPASRPDIEATVAAAVAATVTAAAGTPTPSATLAPAATSNIQATVVALLSTPAVPISTPGQTLVASQNPSPVPSATAVPTATVVPTAPPRTTVIPPAAGAGITSSTDSGESSTPIPPVSLATPVATVALQPTPTPLPPTPTPVFSCQPVADGTVVTAWVDGAQAAFDLAEDGQFALIIEQPESAYYVDKLIGFKIGALVANETAVWEPGAAEILDLTATALPWPDPTPSPLLPASRSFTSSGLLAQLLPPHVVIGAATICSAP